MCQYGTRCKFLHDELETGAGIPAPSTTNGSGGGGSSSAAVMATPSSATPVQRQGTATSAAGAPTAGATGAADSVPYSYASAAGATNGTTPPASTPIAMRGGMSPSHAAAQQQALRAHHQQRQQQQQQQHFQEMQARQQAINNREAFLRRESQLLHQQQQALFAQQQMQQQQQQQQQQQASTGREFDPYAPLVDHAGAGSFPRPPSQHHQQHHQRQQQHHHRGFPTSPAQPIAGAMFDLQASFEASLESSFDYHGHHVDHRTGALPTPTPHNTPVNPSPAASYTRATAGAYDFGSDDNVYAGAWHGPGISAGHAGNHSTKAVASLDFGGVNAFRAAETAPRRPLSPVNATLPPAPPVSTTAPGPAHRDSLYSFPLPLSPPNANAGNEGLTGGLGTGTAVGALSPSSSTSSLTGALSPPQAYGGDPLVGVSALGRFGSGRTGSSSDSHSLAPGAGSPPRQRGMPLFFELPTDGLENLGRAGVGGSVGGSVGGGYDGAPSRDSISFDSEAAVGDSASSDVSVTFGFSSSSGRRGSMEWIW